MRLKIASLLTAIALLTPIAAVAADKPKIITTFTVIADIARNVAGDHAEVESITKAGAEIHNYQPTPRDILKARGASLVLWNGLNLELWFEKFLGNLGSVPNVVVSDGINPMSISGGAYQGKPNPHAWMSPENALIYVENIRKALVALDPDHSADYNANAKTYSASITATIGPLKAEIDRLPADKRWLATSEGAFSYLARDLGLKELFLWPINADSQGSPQQVRAVIDAMRAEKIGVIFSESTVSDKPARQVASETGALYGGVLYVDSLSEADGPVPTYIDLLQVTVATIVKGLSQ
ncbi:MAG: metal ABC transporter substrate-binding protein [Allorhizobium sp.]